MSLTVAHFASADGVQREGTATRNKLCNQKYPRYQASDSRVPGLRSRLLKEDACLSTASEGAVTPSEPSGVQRWGEGAGSPSLGSAVVACIVTLGLFPLEKQKPFCTHDTGLARPGPCPPEPSVSGGGGLAGRQSSDAHGDGTEGPRLASRSRVGND